MSARRSSAALAAVCAMLLLVPLSAMAAASTAASPAQSATPTSTLAKVPVSGTLGHKAFTGHYTVDRFVSRNGKTYALGTLTGKAGQRSVHRANVMVPASIAGPAGARDAAVVSCSILHLVLGPLNLNLLGLHVHLNQVVLDITAVPGVGSLLGNLLCSVANLLNGGGLPVSQVTGLLNILQQLLNNPALANL